MDYRKKAIEQIEAICRLAGSNFPASTDILISIDGEASASVKVPAYVVLELVNAVREAESAQTD